MIEVLLVFLGGSIGATLRYLLSEAVGNFGLSYQGTFIINILGCILFGFVTCLALENENVVNSRTKLFLTTGVAGGFTTFSTFSYECFKLFNEVNYEPFVVYSFLSLFVGIFATISGMFFAQKIMEFSNSFSESAKGEFAEENVLTSEEQDELQEEVEEYV